MTFRWSMKPFIFGVIYSAAIGAVHYSPYLDVDISLPWQPISIIGIAVAFYLGFKNNSAYDRLWEARKIWGAIVNSSRMWGANISAYASNQFDAGLTDKELKTIHKKLIYRHIGWLYALRSQLLIPTSWEHINQNKHIKKTAENRQKEFGVGLFSDEITSVELHHYLSEDELPDLINAKNTATQIIYKQSQELKSLREKDIIDDFRHMELQKVFNDFYTHQGKCERIKKFPLPRQYGSFSLIFI